MLDDDRVCVQIVNFDVLMRGYLRVRKAYAGRLSYPLEGTKGAIVGGFDMKRSAAISYYPRAFEPHNTSKSLSYHKSPPWEVRIDWLRRHRTHE